MSNLVNLDSSESELNRCAGNKPEMFLEKNNTEILSKEIE